MTTPEPRESRPPLRRNRDYQVLMAGRTLAVIGMSMSALALMLLAFDLTGSSALAAVPAIAFLVGNLVAGLPAGVVADRHDRKRVMAFAAAISGLAMLTIPVAGLLGDLTIWQLVAVAVVAGTASGCHAPAESASIRRIVAPDQLGTALSVNQARAALGSVVGPPLAGVLYAVARPWPFVVDGLASLVSAGTALAIRRDLRPRAEGAAPGAAAMLRDIGAGLRYVGGRPALVWCGIVVCVTNFGLNEVFTAVVLDLQRRGTAPGMIGLIDTVAGLAGLAGALLAAPLLQRIPVGRLLVALLGLATLTGCLLLVLPQLATAMAAVAMLMLVVPAVSAGVGAFFMSQVVDAMQGRASSALSFVATGLVPLGTGVAGVVLEHGGRTAALTPGIAAIAAGAVIAVGVRRLRRLPRAAQFVAVAEPDSEVVGG